MAELRFDPLGPEFLREPMAILAQLRNATPVHRHEGTAFPVVSVLRYREAKDVYRDFRRFSS